MRHYIVQLNLLAAKQASELYRLRADARDSQKRVDGGRFTLRSKRLEHLRQVD